MLGGQLKKALEAGSINNPLDTEISQTAFAGYARSIGWVLPADFPPPESDALSEEDLAKWGSEDLWTVREASQLLCGRRPSDSAASDTETNEASAALLRAVRAQALQVVGPVSTADRLYEKQTLRPGEVIAWAKRKHFPKFPDFSKTAALIESEVAPSPGWPWGQYETKLLTKLGLAAKHFWADYDDSKPATAPKNAVVSHWLETEHGVVPRMANMMAQILRADGVRPGPRTTKNKK